jgi:glycosyltransferase involved in cell wall biosynthesis
MRVFHLIKGLGRGGAETLLPEGLRAADRERFTFGYGWFLPQKNALVPAIRELGAETRAFPAANPAAIAGQIPALARFLREWRADLVHAHLPVAGIAARLAGRWAGVPVVYSEHNLQERYHRLTAAANRRTWALQRKVVAVSAEVAASIAERIGGRVPVQVVRNGVSLHHFSRDPEAGAALRRRYGIAIEAPVMGTVAVFRVQKRLAAWLDVAAAVRRARPEARFLLVGDGPLRAEVEAAIDAHRLGDAVILPGLQEDVRPFLSAMDAYVMSSEFEGLPVALLEAMAMEVPVACTAVGGIPEVIRDGVEGWLVDKERPQQLTDRVLELFARGRAMGAAARARVAAEFGMSRMQRELEAIYAEVGRR